MAEPGSDARACLVCGKPVPAAAVFPFCAEHTPRVAANVPATPAPPPRCLICREELPAGHRGPPFCATHRLVYDARQAPGVTAVELDARWLDSLATWRDRPDAVAGPIDPRQVWFRHREGAWLLFWARTAGARGTLTGGWRADWLAVQAETGAVRRFKRTGEVDVWLDLLGVRPIQGERETDEGWGQPRRLAPEEQRRQWAEARSTRHIDVAEDATASKTAVYGLVGRTLGLALSSIYLQRADSERQITSLIFTNFADTAPDPERAHAELVARTRRMEELRQLWNRPGLGGRAWSFTSTATAGRAPLPKASPTKALQVGHSYVLSYGSPPFDTDAAASQVAMDEFAPRLFDALSERVRAELTDVRCRALCQQMQTVLSNYAPELIDELPLAAARAARESFVVDGEPFAAEFLAWPHDRPLCAYALRRDVAAPVQSVIAGAAVGIALDELRDLLARLVVVNDRPDLLAQYNREQDAYGRWLREARG